MVDRLQLDADPASVGQARRFCAAVLEQWQPPAATADRIILLVSELVTNVVLHAGTACEVQISGGRSVRVEVSDGDPTLPMEKHYASDAGSGRGLHLLASLSDRHGADTTATGKRVWFEIELVPVQA